MLVHSPLTDYILFVLTLPRKVTKKNSNKNRQAGNTFSMWTRVFPQACAPLPAHRNHSGLDGGLENLVGVSSFSFLPFCDLSEMSVESSAMSKACFFVELSPVPTTLHLWLMLLCWAGRKCKGESPCLTPALLSQSSKDANRGWGGS